MEIQNRTGYGIKRAVLIVMDSLGIGAMPDAADFGDEGADTFGHIISSFPDLKIENLRRLGFCNIEGAAAGQLKTGDAAGVYCRLSERSKGKDTITGHWEIAGIETLTPFKTYPDGFPEKFIESFEKAIGRRVIGNYPASGTVIIEDLGPEHETTGRPIVYTSADSVFQIAADTDVIPLRELYRICGIAREMLTGDLSCGRVIARPYIIKDGRRVRTADRRDYAVAPPQETLLDNIVKAGMDVTAIGKINDIFDGHGITKAVHTEDNADGAARTAAAIKENTNGLIFTNLVDFDSKYGHRRDCSGYGHAIEAFDAVLPEIMEAMNDDDLLVLTADHGNDPVHSGWDHTREYVPMVAWGKKISGGKDLGTRDCFADIGATLAEILGVEKTSIGRSFASELFR